MGSTQLWDWGITKTRLRNRMSTPNGNHPVRIALRSSVIGASPRSNPRTTPITKTQAEVITSVQRHRSWSRAEKERIVAAAMEPGVVASDVCECVRDIWIDVERGRRAPKLFEQVLGQRDDFAIVMLWLHRLRRMRRGARLGRGLHLEGPVSGTASAISLSGRISDDRPRCSVSPARFDLRKIIASKAASLAPSSDVYLCRAVTEHPYARSSATVADLNACGHLCSARR
jgi:hypothetical protein